ncbi:MAG: 3-deoxy-D-manno-octulosonic acid transferase [Desulfobacterales bacterium]|nr:MAG: 3-deoxy-D-manno-octulosonic acid transferase [Desulfobacterales bacterium]
MIRTRYIPNFLKIYNILWWTALPFLRRNKRLAPTFDKRMDARHLQPSDIWIQSASAGESFLSLAILKQMTPEYPVKVLLTATTDQGLDILRKGIVQSPPHPFIRATVSVFPFDMTKTVMTAVHVINPKVMVLLETELWPGLLHALKKNKTCIQILNARMSAKSLRHYKLIRKVWPKLSPDKVLAISAEDAKRYGQIFPDTLIATMDNIKFDNISPWEPPDLDNRPSTIGKLISRDHPLSILASIRRQEEPDLIHLIKRLQKKYPEQTIAIFTRHMHRITPVFKKLRHQGLSPILGSEITQPLKGPGLILWDRFGELRAAYAHASTVFVGGSLRPLGGQNFLEPAVLGIPTTIGPHWKNFTWIGEQIFNTGVVTRCPNWKSVADTMVNHLNSAPNKTQLSKKITDYILTRRSGSKIAAQSILTRL